MPCLIPVLFVRDAFCPVSWYLSEGLKEDLPRRKIIMMRRRAYAGLGRGTRIDQTDKKTTKLAMGNTVRNH